MTHYKKLRLIIISQLQGAGMYDALKAFHFAERHHTGTRKDGVTPEFQHQIEIALFAMLLPDLMYREEVICVIFLHDVREDYAITDGEIRGLFRGVRQDLIGNAVHCMTKTFRGVVRDEQELFEQMAFDSIASIAKGCDRQHNFLSMVGVFTVPKQRGYIAEGRTLFLPMLKAAKTNYPQQIRAYELITFNLKSQMTLIEHTLEALEDMRIA